MSADPSPDPNILHSPFRDVSIPDRHLSDHVWSNSHRFGFNSALVNGATGRSFSYAEASWLVKSFASSLVKLGLQKGDVVGEENTSQF